MICLKIIKGEKFYQVNICDKNLFGKEIGEIRVSKVFYGEPASNDKIISELNKATLVNALGQESIELLESVKGLMNVNVIDNTPNVILMVL